MHRFLDTTPWRARLVSALVSIKTRQRIHGYRLIAVPPRMLDVFDHVLIVGCVIPSPSVYWQGW